MKTRLSKAGGATTVELEGDLSEGSEAAFAALSGQLEGEIVFDWGKVRKLSSIGVGVWVDFLESLPKDARITHVNASVAFVGYANALEAFLGKGRVTSLHVPFFCDRCDESFSQLVRPAEVGPGMALPPPPCPSCGKPSTPEIELGAYLAFLKP